MPSYPAGAGTQGPEPEPWEYVHVGADILATSAADAQTFVTTVENGVVEVVGQAQARGNSYELYADERLLDAALDRCDPGAPAGLIDLRGAVGGATDLCLVRRSTGMDSLIGCRSPSDQVSTLPPPSGTALRP